MRLKKRTILLISVLLEGALILIYGFWQYFGEYDLLGEPYLAELWLGLLFTLPLFLVNALLFGPLSRHLKILASFREFKDVVVWPLARELDVPTALIVSILAGVGEELFFRGVLQTSIGLILASFAFSLLHFGPAVKSYIWVAAVYFLIGLYFGLVKEHYESLWVPIIAHVVYDFVVLVYMRYFYQPEHVRDEVPNWS